MYYIISNSVRKLMSDWWHWHEKNDSYFPGTMDSSIPLLDAEKLVNEKYMNWM